MEAIATIAVFVGIGLLLLAYSDISTMAEIKPLPVSVNSSGNETKNATSLSDTPLGQLGQLLAP